MVFEETLYYLDVLNRFHILGVPTTSLFTPMCSLMDKAILLIWFYDNETTMFKLLLHFQLYVVRGV